MSDERRETPEDRREIILSHLSSRDRVSVGELAHLLGVSEVTVRKDLDQLEAQGLLTRVHGGAIVSGRGRLELHFATREQQQIEEKRRIAQAAAALIEPHQRIFLDASSTALQIARLIKDRDDLLVITNGLYTALELTFSQGITTIVVGGRMRRRSSSLVGVTSELERLRVDLGFFGAAGVTGRDGLTETDLDEAQLKQWMVRVSGMVIGVVDSQKFGIAQLNAFALPRELDRVITDTAAPPAIINELRSQDVIVDLV
ncbi:MAG: DeoR/GlpR family DNA-binding transcription regulator [Roseiflexaceae bacterium]